jgi:predicted acyl esterase
LRSSKSRPTAAARTFDRPGIIQPSQAGEAWVDRTIELYEFSGLPWFSRRIAKGSRIRMRLDSPNFRRVEKNYNSGGVVADETANDARTAHISLYHDAGPSSYLELPVAK